MPARKPKAPPFFNLYADGSFVENKGIMGSGWVLTKGYKDRKPKRGSATLAGPDASSVIAEIYAVCYGLQRIKHRSRVVVYTDLQVLASALNNPDGLNRWLKSTERRASLHFALIALKDQVQRHISVTAIDNVLAKFFHREAHNLAREGLARTRRIPSAPVNRKGIKLD